MPKSTTPVPSREEALVTSSISAANLARKKELLSSRLDQARENLKDVAHSEATLHRYRFQLFLITPLLVLMVVLAFFTNAWGLEIFEGLANTKRFLIAASMAVVAVVAGIAIGKAVRMTAGPMRRIFLGVGVGALVLVTCATAFVATLRAFDMMRRDAVQHEYAGEDPLDENRTDDADEAFKRSGLEAGMTIAAMAFVGIGAELTSAFLFDQFLMMFLAVWSAGNLRRRVRELEDELLDTEGQADDAHKRAEILGNGGSIAPIAEEPEVPLRRLAWKILMIVLLAATLIVGAVALAYGEGAGSIDTVVLLDRSTSANQRGDEFARNISAVEGILGRVDEPRHRVVVLAIGERGFEQPVLLETTSPSDPGRYGERLRSWRKKTIARWRVIARTLTPTAQASDHFGALARAALVFEEQPATQRRLVLLSDMRHACCGFNLERPIADPLTLLRRVETAGFIPALPGVSVWALGVHTGGADAQQWRALQTFWTEYVAKSGGTLQAFTPARRLFDKPTARSVQP